MYKTVVFDLDGTLLDTLADLAAAVNYALVKNGLPTRTIDEVRGFVGNGAAVLMQLAAGEERSFEKQLLQDFRDYYGAHCAENTKPYDGVCEVLRTLNARGVKTAVLSNKPDFAVKDLSQRYFPNLLTEAAGENEAAGIRKKPAPDALFAIMEKLGSNCSETLYVGDSEVDILTAKNAGVDCLSVTWGFKDERFLLENGAAKLVRTPAEILRFLP